MKEVFVEYENN